MMSKQCKDMGLATLCQWFGISRQAYYKDRQKQAKEAIEEDLVVQQVKQIRKDHPHMGGRKLYVKLQPFMEANGIKMGRDRLFDLLAAANLLIRKRKRRVQTTQSLHRFKKYPNKIKDFTATGINQLWVSDITYWPLGDKYCYISLITDAYSRKIVGYQVGKSLEAKESIQALRMALYGLGGQERHAALMHHSDRGIQYCSKAYTKLLNKHKIDISMTQAGDPLENALAERVNGIIKEEYLAHYSLNTLTEVRERLANVVELYNADRPHLSISNHTPNQVHEAKSTIEIKRLWKNYYQEKLAPVNCLQD